MPDQPPIFILGVHRSGTSLLTRMLEALGVFVGQDLQDDHESRSVIIVNNLYFKATDSSWDAPHYPDAQALKDNCIASLLREKMHKFFNGFGRPAGPWAMKDPRFVTTLPLWRALFPESPVVIIRRDSEDIAKSLNRRHLKLLDAGIFPKDPDFHMGAIKFTQRCAQMEGALSLAHDELHQLDGLVEAGYCPDRLELSYEALIDNPLHQTWKICRFLRLNPDRQAIMQAASMPRSSKVIDPGAIDHLFGIKA